MLLLETTSSKILISRIPLKEVFIGLDFSTHLFISHQFTSRLNSVMILVHNKLLFKLELRKDWSFISILLSNMFLESKSCHKCTDCSKMIMSRSSQGSLETVSYTLQETMKLQTTGWTELKLAWQWPSLSLMILMRPKLMCLGSCCLRSTCLIYTNQPLLEHRWPISRFKPLQSREMLTSPSRRQSIFRPTDMRKSMSLIQMLRLKQQKLLTKELVSLPNRTSSTLHWHLLTSRVNLRLQHL